MPWVLQLYNRLESASYRECQGLSEDIHGRVCSVPMNTEFFMVVNPFKSYLKVLYLEQKISGVPKRCMAQIMWVLGLDKITSV